MNVQDVDLNLLRVFDAVLQERSVTAAAGRLGLTQPAVSNALARLRTLLGDALFVRTPVGMEATPFARGVAEPVRQSLALVTYRGGHRVVEEALERAGLARRISLRLPHFTVVPMVLERTDLICTLPARVARVFERRGKLKSLPPPVPIAVADVAVHWHERFDADQGNRWLREQLIELFGD